MSKFDTTSIENFDTMGADELRQVIAEIEIPDDKSGEMEKLKDAYQKVKNSFDKTASELAAAKKRERDNMSAEDAAKAEHEAAIKDITEKYEALLKESTMNKHMANLTTLGMDGKLAEDTAQALCDGDTDRLFANLAKYKDGIEKGIRADVMKGTPRPDKAGAGTKYSSRDEILGIRDAQQRQLAIAEHPELFGINM